MPDTKQKVVDWDTGDLGALHGTIWKALHLGVMDRHSGFHTPAVATVEAGVPGLRTVVLRQCDERARWLQFHTDARAPKVAALRANPHLTWLFYDVEEKVQLRVGSVATLHADDAVMQQAWETTRLFSRRCYLAAHAPGMPLSEASSGLPQHLQGAQPTEAESEAGRDNFLVVRARVTDIEWLYLLSTGNIAARFAYKEDDAVDATWLAP